MSCGSTPSRVYTSTVKAVCAPSGGPCLPCPAKGTHYQESVFRNASPSCNINTSLLNVDQIASIIAEKLNGTLGAPTLIEGDGNGIVIEIDQYSAIQVLSVSLGQTTAGNVLFSLVPISCTHALLLRTSDLELSDLIATTETTSLIVEFKPSPFPGTTSTTIDRNNLIVAGGGSAFFST